MRLRALILLLPILVFAQDVSGLSSPPADIEYYVGLFAQSDASNTLLKADLIKFTLQVNRKRNGKTEKQFLQYIFGKTHQRYLKTYEPYARFGGLTKNGTYNCLTGTALYALLLDHFGFDYKIIETNYHIFLLVNSSSGNVLFEATDPINGFVAEESEIEKRLAFYKENKLKQDVGDKTFYQYQFKLYNEVTLEQMLGLLHYNLAIEAYNVQQFTTAITHLDKAIDIYNSPRIQEFSKIVLLSVVQSKLEASVKKECIKKIQSLRRQMMPGIASSSASKAP
jgi:hypothetical protein